MIAGKPAGEREKYFNLMLEAGRAAFENIKSEVRYSDVDRAIRKYFRKRPTGSMETPRRPRYRNRLPRSTIPRHRRR